MKRMGLLATALGLVAVATGVAALWQGQRATATERTAATLAFAATADGLAARLTQESLAASARAAAASAQAVSTEAAATQVALATAVADQAAQAAALAARSESQRLAYLAANIPANEPAVAQLLSIEALRGQDTAEARQALWHTVMSHPSWFSRIGPNVDAFAFNPTGTLLVTSHEAGVVRVWDLHDLGRPAQMGEGASAGFGVAQGLVVSPDGRYVYMTDEADHLAVWDLADPARPIRVGALIAVTDLTSLALHPSGRELVTGHGDGTVQRWSLARPDAPVAIGARLAAHPSPIDGLAYRGDGAVLVTTGGPGDRFALWDLRDPAAPALLSEPDFEGKGDQWIERAVFSPNGEQLALTRGETVMVWAVTRPEAPRLLGEWTVPDSVVYDLAYSPDGSTVAVARADGTLTFLGFGLTGGLEVLAARADAEGPVYAIAYQPTGHSLATVNTDGQLTMWRAREAVAGADLGRPVTGLDTMPDFVRYSPDGDLLAVEQVGQIVLLDLRLPANPVQASEPLSMGSLIMDSAFAPDGTWLATADYAGDIAVWDVRDSRAPHRLAQIAGGHPISIWSLALSPDGRFLATGDYDGVVRLWDVRDPASPHLLSEPTSTNHGVHTLIFSADGRRLLAASWDRRVHVWSVEDPAAPTLWGEPFGDEIQSLAYDPDRNLALTGDHDGRLAIWDLNGSSGATPVGEPMPALSEPISDVFYLPASDVLAVGDDALGAVQLWDLADVARPIPYASLPVPGASFRGFGGRPDGEVLALWGFELPLTLVDVGPEALVERACRLAGRNLFLEEWRRYMGERPYQVTCEAWPSGEVARR